MCLELQEIMLPNQRLCKMLNFLQFFSVLNFLVSLSRLATDNPFNIIYDFISIVLLYVSYTTSYYMFMGLFVIDCLFNCFMLFISFSMIIQKLISTKFLTNTDFVSFGIYLLLFFFYVIAIFFTFPIYKEMKAQMLERNNGNLELQNQGIIITSKNY